MGFQLPVMAGIATFAFSGAPQNRLDAGSIVDLGEVVGQTAGCSSVRCVVPKVRGLAAHDAADIVC